MQELDEATIAAGRLGDRQAQARLLSAFQDVWFRFCLSQLRNPDDAREATQETALRFLKQLAGFKGQSQIQTWSLGIALNVVREMKRRRTLGNDAKFDELPAERSSADLEKMERAEQSETLRATLANLPDRQREALVLRFFEDLSTEQTATAMGCAAGTVKATVHQALRALREKMKQLK